MSDSAYEILALAVLVDLYLAFPRSVIVLGRRWISWLRRSVQSPGATLHPTAGRRENSANARLDSRANFAADSGRMDADSRVCTSTSPPMPRLSVNHPHTVTRKETEECK
jgi:hypothetical protein